MEVVIVYRHISPGLDECHPCAGFRELFREDSARRAGADYANIVDGQGHRF